MSNFEMDICNMASGVQFTLRWKDEKEFLLGKAFLKEILGDRFQAGALEPGKTPSYYLENDRLLDALFEFRRKLRERADAGN